MTNLLIISCFFGVCLGIQTLFFRYQKNTIKKELLESKEMFRITYDLLWMGVRDKNDLTYDNMASHIISMQRAELGNVKETLAKRILGETNPHKQIGF